MRLVLIIPALLLAGCNNAGNWKNQQAELADDLNGPATADNSAGGSDTDYVNATAPDANEMDAADMNAADNAANADAPPPAAENSGG
jgi:hypothetical protein